MYFENFDTAENHLNYSLGLRTDNFQAKHNLGVLFLKRSLSQENAGAAAADARRGEAILLEQIQERGSVDAYSHSALVKHKLRYLQRYRSVKFGEEREELKKLADVGLQKHPFDTSMKDAHDEVYRAYLMQAVRERGGCN